MEDKLATWKLLRRPEGTLTILHRERLGAPEVSCGTCSSLTSTELLREWIAEHSREGDLLELEEGTFLRMSGTSA